MNETELTEDDVMEHFYDKNFLVIGLYIPVFLTALAANILVVWVVIKDQYMRSVTNYFLVNLSAADLLVAVVCMPNAAYAAYTSLYNFGEYTCKIFRYLQCVSVASSIFTITAMALDRYLAITRPFGFFNRCFNKRTTIIVIFVLWLLSLILFSPILLVTETLKLPDIPYKNKSIYIDVYICHENWNKDWKKYFVFVSSSFDMRQMLGITWFIFMFVVPGLIMLFAYSMMSKTLCLGVPPFDNNESLSCMQQRNRLMRGRRRVACILLLLAFVFAGCWLPYHIVNLLRDVSGSDEDRYRALKMYLLLLGHANSALNPIIYCALSRKFRRSIKDLLCVSIHFTRRRQNMHQWADSSGSGTQLHYLHRLKSVPTVHNQLHFTLTRLQSSQKTTRTCAV